VVRVFVVVPSSKDNIVSETDIVTVSSGWQPRRTIIFAHWDAGDMGQLGSYEWVEVTYLSVVVFDLCV